MTAWILWAVAITALLGAAAHVLESVLRSRDLPGRWAWVIAMAGGIALQAWALLVENRQPRSVPGEVRSQLPGGGTVSDWWNGIPIQVPSALERLDPYLSALWLVASMVLLTGLLGGFWRLNRRARSWPRRTVAGYETVISESFGPALLGILSPRIVLPRSVIELGHDAAALVCLHEAEHRRARDTWLLAGAAFTVAVLPWNAALWWQVMRLRAAIELDCDKRVVADGVQPSLYASLLLKMGAVSEHLSVAIPAFGQPPTLLERRLTMLIRDVRRQGPAATLASIAATVLLSVAACKAPTPALGPDPSPDISADSSVGPPADLMLRGVRGLSDAPLIFVNGERLESRNPDVALEGLDPDDIESIEVIKGFAAIGRYGADASGGVIEITLKND